MKTFDYQRANSVDDAIKIATLAEGDLAEAQRAFFIAGGTNLLDLMKLEIALPPIDEQKSIVDHYISIDNGLSRLIAIKEEKVKKLDDYKKSLIYEYVTGKKEVV